MKKLIITLLLPCCCIWLVNANDFSETIQCQEAIKDSATVTSRDSVDNQISESLVSFQHLVDSLIMANERLLKSVTDVKADNEYLSEQIRAVKHDRDSVATVQAAQDSLMLIYNKKLNNIGVYILMQPYNAFGVDKIAIPAYETIPHRTGDVEDRYQLLCAYQRHVQEIIEFLTENKIQEGYYDDEQVTLDDKIKELAPKLNGLEVFQSYKGYVYRNETNLWKTLVEIQNIMKKADKKTFKKDLSKILNDLQLQLKAK